MVYPSIEIERQKKARSFSLCYPYSSAGDGAQSPLGRSQQAYRTRGRNFSMSMIDLTNAPISQ